MYADLTPEISQIDTGLNAIKMKIKHLMVERDDAIRFLRSCQTMPPSIVTDAIDKYLDDYDIPF